MYNFCYIFIILLGSVSVSFTQITDELLANNGISRLPFSSGNYEFSPVRYNDGIAYVMFEKRSKNDQPTRGEQKFDVLFVQEGGSPTLFSETINSDYIEGPFCFSANTMFLTRSNMTNNKRKYSQDNSLKLKIFTSKNVDGEWSIPERLDFPAGDHNFCHPAVSQDGKVMIFASDMPGGYGKMDLYVVYRSGDSWTRPENLGPEINTEKNDWFPYFHNDQFLYFATDGRKASGDLDIYEAELKGELFVNLKRLDTPINSDFDDFGLSIDTEGQHLLFSSSRPGKGKDDIYEMKFNQSINKIAIPKNLTFSVTLIDNFSQKSLAGKELKLIPIDLEDYDLAEYNQDIILRNCRDVNATAFSIKTDQKGAQRFSVQTDTKYVLVVDDPEYKESRFFYDPLENDQEWTIGLEPLKKVNPEVISKPTKIIEVIKEEPSIIIPTTKGSKIVFDNIFYEYNSAVIQSGAAEELDALYNTMVSMPALKVELIAHTDSRGDGNYNLKLSKQRAKSAKAYLMVKGISGDRIMTQGLGETQIRNHCYNGVICTDIDHQFNRRTEVKILEN